MKHDISDLLHEWEYDSENNARKIIGLDKKEKIQVRMELGILQMDCDGRPDGKRPYGKESFFDYYKSIHLQYKELHGSDKGFRLDRTVCQKLREEALLYYNRYLILFQMGDYLRTARDTKRNEELFDFISQYATSDEDVVVSEQYRPYIIRMYCSAMGLFHVNHGEYDTALSYVRSGMQRINELPEIDNETFDFERKRSLKVLHEMEHEILEQLPPSEEELLINEINEAVKEERYEDAALIRDELKRLRTNLHKKDYHKNH